MNNQYDLIFVGHSCKDTIIYDGVESTSKGGGVTYGSLAACNYNRNLKIGIFSEVGRDWQESDYDLFKGTTIDLRGIFTTSEKTTNYRIEYHKGGRKFTLQAKANNLRFEKYPEEYKNAKYIIISAVADEISLDFIELLIKETNAYIAIDVQGLIRKYNPDGTIDDAIDEKRQRLVESIIELCKGRLIIKASEDEANYITGIRDTITSTEKLAQVEVIEVTKSIADNNRAIVLTTLGPEGSLIKSKNTKMIHVNAIYPEKEIADETGAGDCYCAVFAAEYLKSKKNWDDMKKAGYCASSACSFLLEEKGPKGFGNHDMVIKRLKNKIRIPTVLHDHIKSNFF